MGLADYFPARSRSIDPHSGKESRHHIDEQILQRAIKKTAKHGYLCTL